MNYRAALNRTWAVLSLLWIAWCLYWPLYARQLDFRDIERELAQTYALCLQTPGMSAASCNADRAAYRQFDRRLSWPATRSLYQSFAGGTRANALSFMAVLCLLPVVAGYLLVRVLFAFLMRLRSAWLTPRHAPLSQ